MQTDQHTPENIALYSAWTRNGSILAVRTGRIDGAWTEVFKLSLPTTGNANEIPMRSWELEQNLSPQTINIVNIRRIHRAQLQSVCDQLNGKATV